MPPATFVRTLAQTAETLIIALAGGTAFTLLGFPAGLVSGSVLAVAAAALLGRPVKVPVPLARACYVLIGILLGAVVTPQTLRGIVAWPVSIALVMIAALGMLVATTSMPSAAIITSAMLTGQATIPRSVCGVTTAPSKMPIST